MFRTVFLPAVAWQRLDGSGRRLGPCDWGVILKKRESLLTSCNATIAVMLFISNTDCKSPNFVALDSSMSISCERKMRSWKTWSRVTPEGSLLEQENKSSFLFVCNLWKNHISASCSVCVGLICSCKRGTWLEIFENEVLRNTLLLLLLFVSMCVCTCIVLSRHIMA
jgi:hypothetical protein